MTFYAPARWQDLSGDSWLYVSSNVSESYGHAEAARNVIAQALDSDQWCVASYDPDSHEWQPVGCVQDIGFNAQCGDEPALIVGDFPYCLPHGQSLQALERMAQEEE